MNIRFLLPTGLILIILSQVSTSCLKKKCICDPKFGCAESCGCENVVVRPPLPKKLPASSLKGKLGCELKLESIGEPYGYDDNYYMSPKYSSSSSHHFDRAELPYPYSPFHAKSRTPPMIFGIDGFDNTENIRDYSDEENGYYYSDQLSSAPVDAVSQALAYQLAKRAGTAITEDGLSFGPRTVPVNGAVTRARSYVPEERLFTFDNQAVEMRYPSARRGASTQEQALLVAQEGYRDSPCGQSANYLTYTDMGYIPEYLLV